MSRPALVLLAGWGTPAAVWTPLLPALQARFEVTALDLLDGGEGEISDYLARLHARTPANAVWLGWSLGGVVAAQYAAAFPARVRQLLLVAVNPCFVRRDDHAHAMPAAIFADFRRDFARDPEAAWQRFLSLQCLGGADVRADRREMQARCGKVLPAPAARLERQLDWLGQEDIRPQLPQLSCPVAWLGGLGDTLVPPAAGVHAFQEATCFADSAHVPFLSEPERFCEWVCARTAGVTG